MAAAAATLARDGLILVTGAASLLGAAVTAQLRASGRAVRTTDTVDLPHAGDEVAAEHWVCALGHDGSTAALVAGVRQILHLEPVSERVVPSLAQLAELDHDVDDDRWLDRCTRCTYNLLDAAARAGVERLVVASSMDQFLAVDADVTFDVSWRPRPGCEPHVLGAHLSELISKEFAAVGAMQRTVIARLGQIVPEAPSGSAPPNDAAAAAAAIDSRFWIGERDAATELAELVSADDEDEEAPEPYFYIGGGRASQLHPHHRRFSIVHIASDAPNPSAIASSSDRTAGGEEGDEGGAAAALLARRAALVKAAWAPQQPPPGSQVASASAAEAGSKGVIVVLGAEGLLGPAVVQHLQQQAADAGAGQWAPGVIATDAQLPADADQRLRREDRKPTAAAPTGDDSSSTASSASSSFVAVNVSDKAAVWSVAVGAAAFVNCAVSRHGRVSAWDVNCKGLYNGLTAAVSAGACMCLRLRFNSGLVLPTACP